MNRLLRSKTNNNSPLLKLPEIVMDNIFKHLDLRDFVSCMLVCKYWYRILNCENTLPWRTLCERMIPKQSTEAEPYSRMNTSKDMLRAYCHGWDKNVCSQNIFVMQNGLTIFHNPLPFGCIDAIHAKIGYAEGVHVWEISWNYEIAISGMMEMVGVSTSVGLNCFPRLYFTRMDNNQRMWAWELRNKFLHRDIHKPLDTYPKMKKNLDQLNLKILLVLDLKKHQLLFEHNNDSLGVAFSNLPRNTKLYPFSMCYASRADVTIVYMGERRKKKVTEIRY